MAGLTKLSCCFTPPSTRDEAPEALATQPDTSTPHTRGTQRPDQLSRPSGSGSLDVSAFAPIAARPFPTSQAPAVAEIDRRALMEQGLADWVEASPDGEIMDRQRDATCFQNAFEANKFGLTLPYHDLTSLPNCLEHLLALKTFDLDGNNLLTLPPSLPPKLSALFVSRNGLQELPELPVTLVALSATDNALKKLPRLPDTLTWIALDYNHLTTLPELPQKLEELDMSHNLLEEFPVLPPKLISFSPAHNPAKLLPLIPACIKFLGADKSQFETTINSRKNELYALTVAVQGQGQLPAAQFPARTRQPTKTAWTKAGDLQDIPNDLILHISAQFAPGSTDAKNLAESSRHFDEILQNYPDAHGRIATLQEQIGILEKHYKIRADSGAFRDE